MDSLNGIDKPIYSKILCCLCGTSIEPNAAAMCIDCLRTQYDITTDIERNLEIIQCKTCNKWLVKLDNWVGYELESTGLMNICLKKILGLQNKSIRLIDTSWVWTEPHSKRLQISLDIEKGILDDKIKLRQRLIVEFVIKSRQCSDCTKEATDHNWGALIQIRQSTNNKRSLLYLENLLVKSIYSSTISNIELKKDGLDLYFNLKNQADKCCEFIVNNIPCRIKQSKKLVSHNSHNHTANIEYTYNVEIPPLLKDDLVILPKEYYGSYDIMLIYRIHCNIHLMNPFTLNKIDVPSSKYFANPFQSIFTSKQLINFIILDIEIIDSFDKSNDKSKIENSSIINDKSNSSKVASLGILAEAVIMREADLGDNDNSFRILTHLGHILQPGDIAAGYDLRHSAANEDLLDTLTFAYPDVILVKKVYSDPISSKKKKSSKRRNRRDRVVNKEVSDEVNDDNNNNNNTDVDIIVNYYDESDDEDDDDDEVLFPPLPPESKDE